MENGWACDGKMIAVTQPRYLSTSIYISCLYFIDNYELITNFG